MDIKKNLKKVALGGAKVLGTTVLAATGIASSAIEYLGGGSGVDWAEEAGHGLKSASFNGIRRMWGMDEIDYDYSAGDMGRRDVENHNKKVDQYNLKKYGTTDPDVPDEELRYKKVGVNHHRRTEEELQQDRTGTDKNPEDFDIETNVSLKNAADFAPGEPGVYILILNGRVMKCGRASHNQGVAWRFTQYYNLNYDNNARKGIYKSVSEENRDYVDVSWQCCPPSKCNELEYKLFKKYGKGPWAQRSPIACEDTGWSLLI